MLITAKEARGRAKTARQEAIRIEKLAEGERRKRNHKIRTRLLKEASKWALDVCEYISEDINKHSGNGELHFTTEELSNYIYVDNRVYDSKPGEGWRVLAKKVSVLLKNEGFKTKILTSGFHGSTKFHISY
ncbi:MAG: hypothetical protein Q8P07_06445 [bacterium]|nr:hypothetical protein [bacterium]